MEGKRIESLKAVQPLLTDWLMEQVNFIPLTGCYSPNYQSKCDLNAEIYKFLQDDERDLMLLAGHSGAGKSLYTQKLISQLWKIYETGKPIPLWISLPECKNPDTALVETLNKTGLNAQLLSEWMESERFIIVLDGYDEIQCLKNLYVSNKLAEWNAKVIITCRHEYLYGLDNFRQLFTPFEGGKPDYTKSDVIYVNPFSMDQIERYVKQYIINNPELHWSEWEQYDQAFKRIVGIYDLIKNPFVLKLAIEALPRIVEQHSQKEDCPDLALTRAALYDAFVTQWFERQEEKLKKSQQVHGQLDIKSEFWRYAMSVAQLMHQYNITQIYYVHEDESIFDSEEDISPFTDYFDSDNTQTQLLQTSCLLREVAPHHYAFWHTSLLEYFLSQNLYDETTELEVADDIHEKTEAVALKPQQKNDYFNKRLLVGDEGVIQFLSDRVADNNHYKRELVDRLFASKHCPENRISAANSITILVRAGVMFNGTDLSGVQIPHSDISGGYFDNTNFSGADLSFVKMPRVWMRSANFSSANMEGVDFGESQKFHHNSVVDNVFYLSDLNYLITSSGNEIYLWNSHTGEKLHEYIKYPSFYGFMSIALSSSLDGRYMVSACRLDKPYKILCWNIKSGEIIKEFIGHEAEIKSLSMNKDGSIFVSGSEDNSVRVWNLSSKDPIVLSGNTSDVTAVSINPKGTHVASGGHDSVIRVWDIKTQELTEFSGHSYSVTAVVLSEKADFVVSAGEDATIRLWYLQSKESKLLKCHQSYVSDVALSYDNRFLASCTGSGDNTVTIRDLKTDEIVASIQSSGNYTACLNFSKCGQFIAYGNDYGESRICRISSFGSATDNVSNFHTPVEAFHYDALNQQLAVGNRRRENIRLYDIKKSSYRNFSGGGSWVHSVLLTSNGKILLSGSDHNLRVINIASGNFNDLIEYQQQEAVLLSIAQDHSIVASGNMITGSIKLWNLDTNMSEEFFKLNTQYGSSHGVASIDISADGRFIACTNYSSLKVFEVSDKSILLEKKSESESYRKVCFSRDGKIVAVAHDYNIELWDIAADTCKVFKGHTDQVVSIFLSLESNILVSGGFDDCVRLWDLENIQLKSLINFSSSIMCVFYSINENLLIVGDHEGDVHILKACDLYLKNWTLYWSTLFPKPSNTLMLCDADISSAVSLSRRNRGLFKVVEKEESNTQDSMAAQRSGSPIYSNTHQSEQLATKDQLDLEKSL